MIYFVITFVTIIVWSILAFIALCEHNTQRAVTIIKATPILKIFTLQVFARVVRLHPVTYIIVYIVQIVLFAAIYWLLPHRSFYHVTAMYERESFSNDSRQILEGIKHVIRDSSIQFHEAAVVTLDGWRMDITSIQVHSIDVANFPDEVSFRIGSEVWYFFSDGEFVQLNKQAQIVMRIYGSRMIVGDMVVLPITVEEEPFPNVEVIPAQPDIGEFLQFGSSPIFGTNLNHQGSSFIVLPYDLYSRINFLGEGYRGFPSGISGQILRMLYLSAGIATSNAFGDVVPITTTARVIVSLQAIVTILVVGFFLNAVGHNIGQNHSA